MFVDWLKSCVRSMIRVEDRSPNRNSTTCFQWPSFYTAAYLTLKLINLRTQPGVLLVEVLHEFIVFSTEKRLAGSSVVRDAIEAGACRW